MNHPILEQEEECPVCNGEGEIWFNSDMGAEHKTCDSCNGTGKL